MKESVRENFLEKDCNCAEAVLRILNEEYRLGIEEEAFKLVSGFGGGCGCGITCGALAGCVAALGRILVEERAHVTPGFKETCGEFCRRFESELGGINCADLKPRYFRESIRCAELLNAAVDCFDCFTAEKGWKP